jgi:uncharacterized protein
VALLVSLTPENYERLTALICLGTEHAWKFDWDDANSAHIARHDVSPDEVESVFRNGAVEISYEEVRGEPRWKSVGHTFDLRVLMIVWTVRRNILRPITAMVVSGSTARDYWRKRRNHYD